MPIKTVKDVDEKTWKKLRMLSTEHNLKMGKLLEAMAEEYSKNSKNFWNNIFDGTKILSDKEADELKMISESLRKERGFR